MFPKFKVLLFQATKMSDLVNRKLHTAGVMSYVLKQSEVTHNYPYHLRTITQMFDVINYKDCSVNICHYFNCRFYYR